MPICNVTHAFLSVALHFCIPHCMQMLLALFKIVVKLVVPQNSQVWQPNPTGGLSCSFIMAFSMDLSIVAIIVLFFFWEAHYPCQQFNLSGSAIPRSWSQQSPLSEVAAIDVSFFKLVDTCDFEPKTRSTHIELPCDSWETKFLPDETITTFWHDRMIWIEMLKHSVSCWHNVRWSSQKDIDFCWQIHQVSHIQGWLCFLRV